MIVECEIRFRVSSDTANLGIESTKGLTHTFFEIELVAIMYSNRLY